MNDRKIDERRLLTSGRQGRWSTHRLCIIGPFTAYIRRLARAMIAVEQRYSRLTVQWSASQWGAQGRMGWAGLA